MLKVAIIFGGFSGERQISEKSAAFVYECLRESYECYLIDIDTKQWSCIIDQQNMQATYHLQQGFHARH